MAIQSSSVSSDCPVCGSTDLLDCVAVIGVPVYCNAVCHTVERALAMRRGDIHLVACQDCGHIFNRVFEAARLDYAVDYENSLHASARFQAYARTTADRLIERYDLRGKQILEIGAGRGEFLALLAAGGNNRCLGIDPSYVDPYKQAADDARLEFIRDHYSSQYMSCRPDLICCRHVLEHLASPRDLLGEIRDDIGNGLDPLVFFEVPNGLYTLRDMGIWDIIYEHRSYFVPSSLQRLFDSCGFVIEDLTIAYDGQFLSVEARALRQPSAGPSDGRGAPGERARLAALAAEFGDRYRDKVTRWTRELEHMAAAGRRVAVWGGGSKGVMFLNTMTAGSAVDCVIDINPRKQGLFVPGTGQPIVAPGELAARGIDTVLIMNPVYRDEIKTAARELRPSAEFFCV